MNSRFPLSLDFVAGIPPDIYPILGTKVSSSVPYLNMDRVDVDMVKLNGMITKLNYYALDNVFPEGLTSTVFAYGYQNKTASIEMSDFYKLTFTNQQNNIDLFERLDFIIGEQVMHDYYFLNISNYYINDNPVLARADLCYLFSQFRVEWYKYILDTFGYKSIKCALFVELINTLNNLLFYNHCKSVLNNLGIYVGDSVNIYLSPQSNGISAGKTWITSYYYGYDASSNYLPLGSYSAPRNLFKKIDTFLKIPYTARNDCFLYPLSTSLNSSDSFGLCGSTLFSYLNGSILVFEVPWGDILTPSYSDSMGNSIPAVYYVKNLLLYRSLLDLENFVNLLKDVATGETDLNPVLKKCCLAECFGITE